ncbi:hypothetical protein SLE2022_269290 [Rubroshorea leprosula]
MIVLDSILQHLFSIHEKSSPFNVVYRSQVLIRQISFLRRRKGTASSKTPSKGSHTKDEDDKKGKSKGKQTGDYITVVNKKSRAKRCSCLDGCFCFVGFDRMLYMVVLVFLVHHNVGFDPQFVTQAITGPLPNPPDMQLSKEGLTAKYPVVFVRARNSNWWA